MDIQKADQHFIHTYNRKITFLKGEGMYLIDDTGRKYLDMGAGIAVSALGYSNDEYKQALKDQVDQLIHISNLYFNEPAVKAASYLCEASGMDRVFFTNSGAEAIEGALKLARKYVRTKNPDNKGEIIAMEHSFHGRTMGALSVTGTKHYREPFEPLIGGVSFAQYNDLDSVKALITPDTCAIIMESLQGEGGIHPATEEFMKGVRALCNEKGIVLILDEIQCGMGRSGKMFAYEYFGIKPDILTAAKALGCGVPLGAFVAGEKVENTLEAGDHGSTYGGNPFATAAANAVFDLFEKKHVLENVNTVAPYLAQKLDELKDKYDFIVDSRGLGLMRGLEFSCPVGPIVSGCIKNGLIVISAGTNVIRFVPPLVITKENVDEMVEVLDKVLAEM